MKKTLLTVFLVALFLNNSIYSYQRTYWHTTKLYNRRGDCHLESSKLKITVNGFYLDVEEEAEIKTVGTVYYEEDKKTLEIIGGFTLTPGSVVRSLLLWNGDDILKAKLMDKDKADSTMDDIVNNTARDPMLVKYEGNNRYSYRIYPVEIGHSRKLRMRYSIPLKSENGTFTFNVTPAFTMGCRTTLSTIPVTFVKSEGDSTIYKLDQKSGKKTLQFDATYLIPTEDFIPTGSYTYVSGASVYKKDPDVSIIPNISNKGRAYTCKVNSTEKAGCYSAIFANTPDTLQKMIEHAVIPNYSIEAKILTDQKGYITTIPENSAYTLYMKSASPWNKEIYWSVYDRDGNEVINYVENFTKNDSSIIDTSGYTISSLEYNLNDSTLPLIWAGNYSLKEGLGDLGAVYGFVDSKMSLLALERDTLPSDIAELYRLDGVPLLLPEEILSDLINVNVPTESIIIEATDISFSIKDAIKNVIMNITQGNILQIKLGSLNLQNLNIGIYDMRGRLVASFKDIEVSGKSIDLKLPNNLKGMFIVKVKSGNVNFVRKLMKK